MRLSELATRIGGAVEGNGDVEVVRGASLEEAGKGDLTFLSEAKYAAAAKATKASAIVLGPKDASLPIPAIRAPHAYLAFAKALEVLQPIPRPAPGVHPSAVVSKSARLGAGAIVDAFAVVEDDVRIGANAWIGAHAVVHRGAVIGDDFRAHSHAVVREGCRLGHRVVLQNGAVVGADGFGFVKRADGSYHKVPQVGVVEMGDDVEVQANACIDRATLGATRIGRGVKIDNLVQVGHNSTVGEDTVLCGQTGLAGSTVIGKRATLGGQSGAAGHMTIGDDAIVMAKAGVIADVPAGTVWAGYPAFEHRDWVTTQAALLRLPDLVKEVRALKKRLDALEGKGKAGGG
jgi:UDP-3-O-[3-hydroxymyristoyl] glucosamine N-acyltransferase